MEQFIQEFSQKAITLLNNLPKVEIAKAMNILQAAFERDGRIYVIGNGGSLALATHWVADFNKTVFSHNLDEHQRRFQAIRLPTTEEELTAWANDVGYDMVFSGPLRNYIQDSDVLIAISSSGNSENIIRAVELAHEHKVPVIGISGFDGGTPEPTLGCEDIDPNNTRRVRACRGHSRHCPAHFHKVFQRILRPCSAAAKAAG